MHRVAEQVEAAVRILLLHIANATAERVRAQEMRCVGLLGTAFTMEQDFYKGRRQRELDDAPLRLGPRKQRIRGISPAMHGPSVRALRPALGWLGSTRPRGLSVGCFRLEVP